MRRATHGRRQNPFSAAMGFEPRNPFRPPRAVGLLGACQPGVGIDVATAGLTPRYMELAPVMARLRHHAGIVAAIG